MNHLCLYCDNTKSYSSLLLGQEGVTNKQYYWIQSTNWKMSLSSCSWGHAIGQHQRPTLPRLWQYIQSFVEFRDPCLDRQLLQGPPYNALIDSGATSCFIDIPYVEHVDFRDRKKPISILVEVVDGSLRQAHLKDKLVAYPAQLTSRGDFS